MNRRSFLAATTSSLSCTVFSTVVSASSNEPDASIELATSDDPRPQLGGDKVRPVISGIAEMPSQYALAYGTGGPLAERTGGQNIDWHTNDRFVRASNRHVYCADLGDKETQPIDQPSLNGTVVGEMVGFGEYDDDVDVAFRTMNEWEYGGVFNLDYLPQKVVSPSELSVGDTVEKVGARTMSEQGQITATNIDVLVRYTDTTRKMEQTIQTTDISNGGDSGSAAFRVDDNALIGLIFAGNDSQSYLIPATRIEDRCDVSFLTEQMIVERYTDYIDGANDELEADEVVDAISQYNEHEFSPIPRAENIVDLISRFNE